MAAYDRALELHPDDPDTLSNRGVSLGRLGRDEEALGVYDRALELRPDDPGTHYNRGNVLSRLDREEALAAYDRALELGPDHPATHYNRGIRLGVLGRHGEALAAFDRALELRSDHADTHYSRGNALGRLGRNEEALVAFDRALELRSDDPSTLNNRGVALERLGRYRQAAEIYQKATRAYERSGGPNALPHANRGEALYQHRWFQELHLQQAAEEFRRALDLDEKSLRARNGLGICLLKLGDPAGAAVEFLRAAEQAPDDPDFRYNYAVACARQKRTDRAKTELARILDDHLAYEPARRALDLLSAPSARPDLWQAWTQGSAWRRVLGIALLAALGLLVVLPIFYLLRPSIDSPTLPWQYYVAALVIVAGALVLPSVRQFEAFGVKLEPQPPGPAEAQLEPVLLQ